MQQFDDLESSREGAGQRDTSAHVVRKHLEDIGLDGDIAQYNEISGLSGGMCTSCGATFFLLAHRNSRTKDQACNCCMSVEQSSGTDTTCWHVKLN